MTFNVDDIYGGGEPPPAKVRIPLYVHRDKESNDYVIEEGELTAYKDAISDDARRNFWYAALEVELNCEVELATGDVMILGVKGVPLAEPVKA